MRSFSFKKFMSINEIKDKGEFFRSGQVIPRRILKVCKSKSQHKISFYNDCYAFSTPRGYVVFVDNSEERPEAFLVRDLKCCALNGSPYGGHTHWHGAINQDPIELVNNFNSVMAKRFY